jgi:hypothetical protein
MMRSDEHRADERLLQCAYREPDADREPHAHRQPDDEPFASITHGDTPARQLGQHHHLAVEPYWEAERVLGEATLEDLSILPRRFSCPTREAASCIFEAGRRRGPDCQRHRLRSSSDSRIATTTRELNRAAAGWRGKHFQFHLYVQARSLIPATPAFLAQSAQQ